ncbi:MAG: TniQ family protein [Dehalococcoidia bacterium]|nr:TniQ family protein [Dehalococcoidia bacterium]
MPLPRVLRSLPGEAFASFIERNARFQNVQVVTLLHRIGLIDVEEAQAIPNGYGVFIEPGRKEVVAGALRLSAEGLDALLLEGLNGVAYAAQFTADGAFDLRGTTMGAWVYMAGSHTCPECVGGENGYWRTAWKLPWSVACVEHQRMLAAECPSCERRFASWRRDKQVKPSASFTVPAAGRCLNVRGGGPRGHRTGACDHDITTVDTLRLDPDSEILAAQAWIDAALGARYAVIGGERVPALEFFRVLRGFSALMLYAATPSLVLDLVPGLPAELRRSFEVDARERAARLDAARRDAELAVAAGRRQKPGSQKETAFAPTDPHVMGVLVAACKAILDAPDVVGIAKRARPLLGLAMERVGGGASYLNRLGLPPVFSQLHALAFDAPRSHRFPRKRLTLGGIGSAFGFEARHVPAVYWAPEYFETFEPFFRELDVLEITARQTVSLMLAEMVVDDERDAAFEAIGIGVESVRPGVRRATSLIRNQANYDEFVEALHEEAKRISQAYEQVDYAARRARFSDFAAIPAQDWAFIAGHAGIGAGQDGGRNHMAAAWVWTQLTQGDHRTAPALTARPGTLESIRQVYRSFLNGMGDDLLLVLWGYVDYLGRGGQPGVFQGHALNFGYSAVNGVFGYGFELRHVPSLFWRGKYESRFRHYFRALGVADKTGRAAMSVMLAELIVSMTRTDLGSVLGLDERSVRSGVSAAIQRVRAGDGGQKLRNDIQAFALELSEDPKKVDFEARRAALRTFRDIPDEDWAEICRRAGVGKGRVGVRSKQAAAWLWAELVQADARSSPAFADLEAASQHAIAVFDQFVRTMIPKVGDEIVAYGKLVTQSLANEGVQLVNNSVRQTTTQAA